MGDPILFTKYHANQLNILDVEKKLFILKQPLEADKKGD